MRQLRMASTVLLLALSANLARAADAKKLPKLPKFDIVKATVHREIARHPGYRNNDIITREWVAQALDAVEKQTGWKIEDRNAITAIVLPNRDYMVQQLRTRKGTTFMRHFSGTPEAFDRLDRLRRLPMGRRRIPELMNNAGGYTLVLYLAQTPSGHNMGLYLDQLRGVKNFNKPTGRLYTEKQLVDRLQKSYRQEQYYRKFGRRPTRKAGKKRR